MKYTLHFLFRLFLASGLLALQVPTSIFAAHVPYVHNPRNLVKPCPNCHVEIAKDGGCKWVFDPRCNHTFCWECYQGPWLGETHTPHNCRVQGAGYTHPNTGRLVSDAEGRALVGRDPRVVPIGEAQVNQAFVSPTEALFTIGIMALVFVLLREIFNRDEQNE